MPNIDYEKMREITRGKEQQIASAWKGRVFGSSTPMLQLKQFPEGDTYGTFLPSDPKNNPRGYFPRCTHKVQFSAARPAEVWKCLGDKSVCPVHEIIDDILIPIIDPESEDYNETFFLQEDKETIANLITSKWIYAFVGIYNPVVKVGTEKSADGSKEYSRYAVSPLSSAEQAYALADREEYTPAILQIFAPGVCDDIEDLFKLNPLINDMFNGTIWRFKKAHTTYELVDTQRKRPLNLFPEKVKKYPDLQKLAYKNVKEISAAQMKAALTSQECWWFHYYGFSFDPAEPSVRDAAGPEYLSYPNLGR